MATLLEIKKHNTYYEFRLSNKPQFLFLCDLEDLERLETGSWYVHVGSKDKTPYIRRQEYPSGKQFHFHREVMSAGDFDIKHVVDHRDRNTLDCRKSNLRVVTQAINAQNTSRVKYKNESIVIDGHRLLLIVVNVKRKNYVARVYHTCFMGKIIAVTRANRKEFHIKKLKNYFNKRKGCEQEQGTKQ